MTNPVPEGASVQAVSVTTAANPVQQGTAIPVYGYADINSLGAKALTAGAAMRVRVLTNAEMSWNGGSYVLEGRPLAMPVVPAPAGMPVTGGPIIAIYVVGGIAPT